VDLLEAACAAHSPLSFAAAEPSAFALVGMHPAAGTGPGGGGEGSDAALGRALQLRRQWLALAGTFYWAHTAEADGRPSPARAVSLGGIGTAGPVAAALAAAAHAATTTGAGANAGAGDGKKNVDVRGLIGTWTAQFHSAAARAAAADARAQAAAAAAQSEEQLAVFEHSAEDVGCGLLADVDVAKRVRWEWARAGAFAAAALAEPPLLTGLLALGDLLATLLRLGTGAREGRLPRPLLSALATAARTLTDVALRYTLFDAGDFRELQSLAWSADAALSAAAAADTAALTAAAVVPAPGRAGSGAGNRRPRLLSAAAAAAACIAAEADFLALARVCCVQLDVRLRALTTRNLTNCPDAAVYSHGSPTLSALLDPSRTDARVASPDGAEVATTGALVATAPPPPRAWGSVDVPWSWAAAAGPLRLLQPTAVAGALAHVDPQALLAQVSHSTSRCCPAHIQFLLERPVEPLSST
jgi:hypothetical protein